VGLDEVLDELLGEVDELFGFFLGLEPLGVELGDVAGQVQLELVAPLDEVAAGARLQVGEGLVVVGVGQSARQETQEVGEELLD
jgi:hypothetical protein